MVDISLILPTRERPALAQRMLESVVKTAASPSSIEVILYIDDDDDKSLTVDCSGLEIVKIVGPRKSMGEMTQSCYERSRGRLIVLVNDDLVFRTQGWDQIVRRKSAHFADDIFLLYPNDGYYGKKLSTFPILSRHCCAFLGALSSYQSHCIDSHIFNIFERLERLGHSRRIYVPEIVFEHLQHSSEKEDDDDRSTYHALAEERERAAYCLSQEIKSAEDSMLSCASLMIYNEGETPISSIASHFLKDLKSDLVADLIIISPEAKKIEKEIPRRLRKKVKICWSEGGLAQQLNEAARQAAGHYLLFLDHAAYPEPRWIEPLIQKMRDRTIGALGSLWINPRNGRVEHAGYAFLGNHHDIYASNLYRGVLIDHPVFDSTKELQAVGLNGMLVRKEAFQRIGGFSDRYLSAESVDLCLRLKKEGYSVQLEPQARIRYIEPWKREEKWSKYNWCTRAKADLLDLLRGDRFVCHALPLLVAGLSEVPSAGSLLDGNSERSLSSIRNPL